MPCFTALPYSAGSADIMLNAFTSLFCSKFCQVAVGQANFATFLPYSQTCQVSLVTSDSHTLQILVFSTALKCSYSAYQLLPILLESLLNFLNINMLKVIYNNIGEIPTLILSNVFNTQVLQYNGSFDNLVLPK